MLKSILCDYSDTYVRVTGTIEISNTGRAVAPNNKKKNRIIKTCTPLSDSMKEINNTQIDNAKDSDVVMSMYNFIEFSDNYSQTT